MYGLNLLIQGWLLFLQVGCQILPSFHKWRIEHAYELLLREVQSSLSMSVQFGAHGLNGRWRSVACLHNFYEVEWKIFFVHESNCKMRVFGNACRIAPSIEVLCF